MYVEVPLRYGSVAGGKANLCEPLVSSSLEALELGLA